MKKMDTRHSLILEKLSATGKIEVDALAKQFDVSVVTIRKDLTLLEEKGLLKREPGCAVINNENDMNRRLSTNYEVKCRIAKEASHLVEDGETIMVESGSCCILLAEHLSRTKKNLTIITNSVFLATYIGKHPHTKIILLGGDFQADSQAVVGPITRRGAKAFHVDKLFIGTDGYIPNVGFTGDNHLRVETLKDMAESANQVIVLTESKKFFRQGIVPLFTFEDVQYVFTDQAIPHDVKASLLAAPLTLNTNA